MKGIIQTLPGRPLPKGARRTRQGINFTLFSRQAETVTLLVRLPNGTQQSFPLDPVHNKTGDIWHILLVNAPPELRYGYTISGPDTPAAEAVLLDPCARALVGAAWGKPRPELGTAPCCLIDHKPYDWEDDQPPRIPMQDTIIYELHLRGFTQHPSSAVAHPGTYRGLTEKIDYLKELGITAVELLPVTEFDENETLFTHPVTKRPLKNYWGYHPFLFGAPKAAYASRPGAALTEFRDMVKALHRAGIEVFLDVVFNHTAEGGAGGKTTCFRGIDKSVYYLMGPNGEDYLNFSGCGNTCNCNHPIVRQLIMDTLRWWVVEMHVDGFRFDLASILNRGKNGEILANPPVVEMLAEDPILANTKIIAEAWDAGGLYQVGSFSTSRRWAEWNGRFRDDARAFMRGQPGAAAHLATRLAGSSDLYRVNDRSPCNSINFLTSHDGFTLMDLVSYNGKHNEANGEQNRDGDNNNLSWNSGAEGPTRDKNVLALRARRIRSFAVILLLSSGVPMLVAGDEFGRSQGGNNNAWNQDNETSWIDWQLAQKNKDLLRFFTELVHLRASHPSFRRTHFFAETESGLDAEIRWFGEHGTPADWSAEGRALAFLLRGVAQGGSAKTDDDFFVALNGKASDEAVFIVPPPPIRGRRWSLIIDTAAASPLDICPVEQGRTIKTGERLLLPAMGCVVLQSTHARRRK